MARRLKKNARPPRTLRELQRHASYRKGLHRECASCALHDLAGHMREIKSICGYLRIKKVKPQVIMGVLFEVLQKA